MPIGAVVGAVGTVASGISSGKGAKKAAKIQADAAAKQQALQREIYNQNKGNFQTEINSGNVAAGRIDQLLGLTDGGEAATALLRSTPGYQFRLAEGLKGVNSNAYASGLGMSGATLKALQTRAANEADQTFDRYYGQVSDVANRGSAAKSSLAGVSQNYANASNTITQNGANTAAGYEMFKANNLADMIKGVAGAAGQGLGGGFGGSGGGGGASASSYGVNNIASVIAGAQNKPWGGF